MLDLGRRPEARFLGVGGGEYLRGAEVNPQKILHLSSAHLKYHLKTCQHTGPQLLPIDYCLYAVQITWEDLKAAEEAVGDFGSDNRAGVQGTLHRISAMCSRKGTVVGLTCRVGRAVTGHVDMIRDILDGRPPPRS